LVPDADWYVFPTGVEKIEFYRASPPPNTVVAIRCEVVEFDLDRRTFRANIEVEDGEGALWMRIAGWTDWLFRWPPKLCEWMRNPFASYASDEIGLPGLPDGTVCAYVTKSHLKNIDVDRVARILLHREEMPAYWAINSDHLRWQSACSRMASKDAARLWMGRQHKNEGVHPAALIVEHDDTGRPTVWSEDQQPTPKISVAHSGTTAIALASEFDVGIDIEPADCDVQAILDHAATSAEIALIESMATLQPTESWGVRLWCAKEAVGKVLGKGLHGRPKDFVAIDINESGQLLVEHEPTGARYVVDSVRFNDMILAYTTASALVAEPLPLA
jgi:phosphopantetheinyl transferase